MINKADPSSSKTHLSEPTWHLYAALKKSLALLGILAPQAQKCLNSSVSRDMMRYANMPSRYLPFMSGVF